MTTPRRSSPPLRSSEQRRGDPGMRRLLLSTVVATLVATDLLAPTGAGAEARQSDVIRLDGVRVELPSLVQLLDPARVPVIGVGR